jgi:hypothetical protein
MRGPARTPHGVAHWAGLPDRLPQGPAARMPEAGPMPATTTILMSFRRCSDGNSSRFPNQAAPGRHTPIRSRPAAGRVTGSDVGEGGRDLGGQRRRRSSAPGIPRAASQAASIRCPARVGTDPEWNCTPLPQAGCGAAAITGMSVAVRATGLLASTHDLLRTMSVRPTRCAPARGRPRRPPEGPIAADPTP